MQDPTPMVSVCEWQARRLMVWRSQAWEPDFGPFAPGYFGEVIQLTPCLYFLTHEEEAARADSVRVR